MTDHAISGYGAPTAVPPSIGAHYTDLLTGKQYLAKGTLSVGDWIPHMTALAADGQLKTVKTSSAVSSSADGAIINATSTNDISLYISPGGWVDESRLIVIRGDGGEVRLKAGLGVELLSSDGLRISKVNGVVFLKHLGDNVWNVSGDLAGDDTTPALAVGLNAVPALKLYESDSLAGRLFSSGMIRNIQHIAFSADGEYMAVGGQISDGVPGVTVYSVRTAVAVAVLEVSSITALTFSPNGEWLAVAGHQYDNVHAIRIYTVADWTQVDTGLINNGHTFYALAFSPDSNYLVGVGNLTTAIQFKTSNWSITSFDFELPNTGRTVAYSPDGRYLVIGHDGAPYLSRYHVGTKTKLPDLGDLPPAPIISAAFSPDGTKLAVGWGTASPYLRLYDAKTWEVLPLPAELPTGGVERLSWNHDSSRLAATLAAAPYIKIYDVANGLSSVPFPNAPGNYVNTAVFGNPLVTETGVKVHTIYFSNAYVPRTNLFDSTVIVEDDSGGYGVPNYTIYLENSQLLENAEGATFRIFNNTPYPARLVPGPFAVKYTYGQSLFLVKPFGMVELTKMTVGGNPNTVVVDGDLSPGENGGVDVFDTFGSLSTIPSCADGQLFVVRDQTGGTIQEPYSIQLADTLSINESIRIYNHSDRPLTIAGNGRYMVYEKDLGDPDPKIRPHGTATITNIYESLLVTGDILTDENSLKTQVITFGASLVVELPTNTANNPYTTLRANAEAATASLCELRLVTLETMPAEGCEYRIYNDSDVPMAVTSATYGEVVYSLGRLDQAIAPRGTVTIKLIERMNNYSYTWLVAGDLVNAPV